MTQFTAHSFKDLCQRFCVLLFSLFQFSASAQSGAQPGLVAAEWSVLNSILGLGTPGRPYTLSILPASLPIQSSLSTPTNSPAYFRFIDRVPLFQSLLGFRPSGNLPETVFQILSSQIDFVEVLSPPLTDTDKARFQEAIKTLYQDEAKTKPTTAYADYLVYKSIIEALRNRLAKANTEDERRALRQEILDKEADWPDKPQKLLVEQALATVRSYSNPNAARLDRWKADIKVARETSVDSVLVALADRQGWLTVVFSTDLEAGSEDGIEPSFLAPLNGRNRLFVRRVSEVDLRPFDIPAPLTIQMQLKRVEIPRPYLDFDVFLNRGWRFANGRLLSDGATAPGGDDNEILPRATTQVVLCRNVEIYFRGQDHFESVCELLKDDDIIEILVGNISIKSPNQPNSPFYPKVLFISIPQVLALVAQELPKSPNPER